jgi:uncharacterized Zn ribbon protein
MSVKFGNSLDLQGNQLLNAAMERVTTNGYPTSPSIGQMVFDTDIDSVRIWDGAAWESIGDTQGFYDEIAAGTGITVTNGTGGGTATVGHGDTSSISNLTATARTYVDGITFDDFGHITAITTSAETVTNSDTTYSLSSSDGTNAANITLTPSAGGSQSVTLAAGNNVTIAESAGTITITSDSGANTYVSAAAFDNTDGDLVMTLNGGTTVTANLDGRYLTAEADTLDSVTDRGATTTNAMTVGGLTVNGDLTVTGANNVVLGETVEIEDSIFLLSKGTTGTPALDAGLIVERGTASNVGMIWDESADEFSFISTAETATDGSVTISDYVDLKAGDIVAEDTLIVKDLPAKGSAATKFVVEGGTGSTEGRLETRTASQMRSDIGAGTMTSFVVTDGTTDETVSNGDSVEFTGSGNISVSQAAGVVTISSSNNNYSLPSANTTTVGGVELATTTEAAAGTDSSRAVTAQGVTSWFNARRFKASVGNGSATSFSVNHGLNSTDIIVQVWNLTTGEQTFTSVEVTDANNIAVEFADAPTANQYRVIVMEL